MSIDHLIYKQIKCIERRLKVGIVPLYLFAAELVSMPILRDASFRGKFDGLAQRSKPLATKGTRTT